MNCTMPISPLNLTPYNSTWTWLLLIAIMNGLGYNIFNHLKCPRRIGYRDTQIAYLISLIRAYQDAIIINDSTKEDQNIETQWYLRNLTHCNVEKTYR